MMIVLQIVIFKKLILIKSFFCLQNTLMSTFILSHFLTS